MRISLCMIVRDEADALPAALESVRGVVDEVIVADTGSQDASAAVARAHGAQILDVAWREDFSFARNAVLERASGDWALVIDADEVLLDAERAGGLLRAFAEGHAANRVAGRVRIENDLGGDEPRSVMEATRFFPVGPAWRYSGRIHEQVLYAGVPPRRADTLVRIAHRGYAPEFVERKQKLARNERLLRLELAASPDDSYARFQLGRTLQRAGRVREALLEYERALLRARPESFPAYAQLAESTATTLRSLGMPREALVLLGPVLERYPRRADSLFLASLLELDLGKIERAERGFRRCLELDEVCPDGGESCPAAARSAAACNLGVICEVLGRTVEAREFYRRALAHDPGHRPSREGLSRLGLPGDSGRAA